MTEKTPKVPCLDCGDLVDVTTATSRRGLCGQCWSRNTRDALEIYDWDLSGDTLKGLFIAAVERVRKLEREIQIIQKGRDAANARFLTQSQKQEDERWAMHIMDRELEEAQDD